MISIMLVGKQESALQTLQRFLEADPELELIGSAPGGEAALVKIENNAPELLLIHAGTADSEAISLAERVILRKPRTFVVLVPEAESAELRRAANEAGCHNILAMPANAEKFCQELRRICRAESERIEALDSNRRVSWTSKVITVFGAKGGLGKSTIASNLAVKLAMKSKKVAVVDLDLQFGDIQICMDLEPKETIADLMQDMTPPGIDMLRTYMNVHPSGAHVLCAPKSPEYAEIVSGDRVSAILSVLRSCYDYVIVDTAANFSDVTLAALDAASIILFVTGLDISILKNSKLAMNIIESLGHKKKVRVIINRAVEINTITVSDVQNIVDAPILARIPSDYLTAVSALNQGLPFVVSQPKSKLALAVSDIADKIISGNDSFDLQKLSARERRKLLRKYRTKEKAEKKRIGRKRR